MHFCNLLSHILLISVICFSTVSSSLIGPQGLLIKQLEPLKSSEDADNGMTQLAAPQLELHLRVHMKSPILPDKKHTITEEHGYSDQNYDWSSIEDLLRSDKKEESISKKILNSDEFNPQTPLRTIIEAPSRKCPDGARRNKAGVCKDKI